MMIVIYLSFKSVVKKLIYTFSVVFLVISSSAGYASNEINLLKAVELTLLNDKDLLAKSSRFNADKQAVNQAWASVRPSVAARFSAGKSQYSTRFESNQKANFNRASLTVSQVLYSRKRFLNLDRAKLNVQGKKYLFEHETQVKVLQVITAYINLLKLTKLKQIAKEELEDDLVSVSRIESMLKLGLSTRMDVLEALSRTDTLRANLIADTNNKLVAKKQLERYLGISIKSVEPIDVSMWQRSADIIAYKQWDSMVFTNSLLLKTMESRVSTSKLDIKMARAEHFPELNLHLNLAKTGSYETAMLNNNKIYVELVLPLYDGGRTSSRLSAATFLLSSDQYFFEKEQQNLHISLREVLSRLEGSQANIIAYQKSKASSLAFVRAAQKGLEHGINSVADVLRAKERMYHSERLLSQAIYQNLSSQFELLFLTGSLNLPKIEAYLSDSFSIESLL